MGKRLNYYESDAFNQPDNFSKAFHIQNYIKPECQYFGTQFVSNNKLYNYL